MANRSKMTTDDNGDERHRSKRARIEWSNELPTSALNSHYMNALTSDVLIRVGPRVFPAHRCLLAQRSHYFEALFGGGFAEQRLDQIELKETNDDTFELLLLCFYDIDPGFEDFDTRSISEFLEAAQFFLPKMDSCPILSLPEKVLKSRVNGANLFEMLQMACDHSMDSLIAECLDSFGSASLENLKRTNSLLGLSPVAIRTFVSSDTLCVPEADIFRVVREWLTANRVEARSTLGRSILEQVRLHRMSRDEMEGLVLPTGLYNEEAVGRTPKGERGVLMRYRDLCKKFLPSITTKEIAGGLMTDLDHSSSGNVTSAVSFQLICSGYYIVNALSLSLPECTAQLSQTRISLEYLKDVRTGWVRLEKVDSPELVLAVASKYDWRFPRTVVGGLKVVVSLDCPKEALTNATFSCTFISD